MTLGNWHGAESPLYKRRLRADGGGNGDSCGRGRHRRGCRGKPPGVWQGNEVPMRRSTKITQPLIRQMVKRIVQKFDPEQVILFGSQARGEAGPDSDVDLLLVMDVKGKKSDIALEIRRALREFVVPVDILVTTPEDFAWRKDVVGTIEWPASKEGKVMYARV